MRDQQSPDLDPAEIPWTELRELFTRCPGNMSELKQVCEEEQSTATGRGISFSFKPDQTAMCCDGRPHLPREEGSGIAKKKTSTLNTEDLHPHSREILSTAAGERQYMAADHLTSEIDQRLRKVSRLSDHSLTAESSHHWRPKEDGLCQLCPQREAETETLCTETPMDI